MSGFTEIPPVIVLSPIQRAGTTLVQRLLCSASNALIYGDTVGQEVEFFAKYATARGAMLGYQQSDFAPVRRAVLAGNVSDFITPLAPTLGAYLDGFRQAAHGWLEGCQREALEAGRPVWGWKLAGADGSILTRLAAWFPEAKWVWIERNLTDCLRSAKAANMFQDAAGAATMASFAHASRQAFAGLKVDALRLDYETMIAAPADTIRQLEAFTGARDLDAKVFDQRINQLGAKSWLPPAALTAEELAAIHPFSTAA